MTESTESNIQIISDGTSRGTKLLIDGQEAKMIESIEIEPITRDTIIKAKVTFLMSRLDLSGKMVVLSDDT